MKKMKKKLYIVLDIQFHLINSHLLLRHPQMLDNFFHSHANDTRRLQCADAKKLLKRFSNVFILYILIEIL